MTDHQPRKWFVTGASSGFGRAIAEAALAAGDTVVAAARRPDAVADLVESAPDRVTAYSSTSRIRIASRPPSTPCSIDTGASTCW